MNKQEFLDKLKAKLRSLPKQDVNERLNFYSDMIDDRIEEGVLEEEAVFQIGSVDAVAAQIVNDIPLGTIVKEKLSGMKKLTAREIVLLIVGFPIWFPLLISAFAVALPLYISLWAIVISLWAVFVSLIACGVAGLIAGIIFALTSNALTGIALIAAACVCAGLGILFFFPCQAATNGSVWLAKKFLTWLKNRFLHKENNNE